MARLAPSDTIRGVTVAKLAQYPTWHLRLVPGHAKDGIRVLAPDTQILRPAYNISPIPLRDLPRACAGVAHIDAAAVTIAPTAENAEGRYVSFWLSKGKTFVVDGNGTKSRYFRHRHMWSNFEREIDVLGRILQAGLRRGECSSAGLGSGEVRVACLTEVVTSIYDNAIGFTTEWISGGFSLFSERAWEDPVLARKWEEQITQTVKALHAHDIF